MHAACYRVADRLIRLYWFVCRPRTYGARCVVVCGQHLLLIRQTYGDRRWTLPGGRLAKGEVPEAAVRREVREEVGITLDAVTPLGQFVSTQSYNTDTVSVFTARTPSRACAIDRREVAEAHWFAVGALPPVAEKTATALGLWQQHERERAQPRR
jgi:ADP-ribose pyrophosphatase YjhB (NUDIX family)